MPLCFRPVAWSRLYTLNQRPRRSCSQTVKEGHCCHQSLRNWSRQDCLRARHSWYCSCRLRVRWWRAERRERLAQIRMTSWYLVGKSDYCEIRWIKKNVEKQENSSPAEEGERVWKERVNQEPPASALMSHIFSVVAIHANIQRTHKLSAT